MTLLFCIWLACGTAAGPKTTTLPDAFATMSAPGEPTIKKHEGNELVLDYPEAEKRPTAEAWARHLESKGWTVEPPSDGGRFMMMEAKKDTQTLEVFVVSQPNRTEVHLELGSAGE